MASDGSGTVTIERAYLQTLLRRAQYNSVDGDSFVSISQAEYDGLVDVARQYANLKRNLMLGGVPEETLALLSRDDAESDGQTAAGRATGLSSTLMSEDGGAMLHGMRSAPTSLATPSQADTSRGGAGNYAGFSSNYFHSGGSIAGPRQQHTPSSPYADPYSGTLDDALSEDTTGAPGGGPAASAGGSAVPARPQFERIAQRTLLLSNLDPMTTHAEVTRAVRGGMLLEVFLRAADRTASVSFLRSADARAWFEHVKRYDLYIRNKRVDVRWSERQFVLPGHVANKIGIGATRNLVVRRCDPRHTAKSIVEDLEHIHNLVVIRVEFLNSSCYISTNSVHNAMFARTCMMSRGKYKGSKIEWDADECAQPLERPPHVTNGPGGRQPPRRENSRSMAHQRRKSAAGAAGVVNRFQLLNLDPDDGKSDDENGNAEDGSTRPGGSLAGPAVALPTAANEVGIAA